MQTISEITASKTCTHSVFVKKGEKISSLSSNLRGLPGVGKGITKYMGSPPLLESVDEGVEGVSRKML